jgi:hypothetical protein
MKRAKIALHNPANAASWSDEGIADAYEQVRSLVEAGLKPSSYSTQI